MIYTVKIYILTIGLNILKSQTTVRMQLKCQFKLMFYINMQLNQNQNACVMSIIVTTKV